MLTLNILYTHEIFVPLHCQNKDEDNAPARGKKILPRALRKSATCERKTTSELRQAKCKNVTIKKFNNNTKIKLELWH